MLKIDSKNIQPIDDRREVFIPGNQEESIRFSAEHWIEIAKKSIQERGRFAVALSGGSTPNAIYRAIELSPQAKQVDWSKVLIFWSDERSVTPEHSDSNYRSAMESGLSRLPIPSAQIFRMKAEKEIERASEEYEALIRKTLGVTLFDLVMLGLGPDGHTASLFPNTKALQAQDRLVVANHVPEKKAWRMTLTIPCINQSWRAVFYVFGSSKQTIVWNVLKAPKISEWPASQIGTIDRKALYILDDAASILLRTP